MASNILIRSLDFIYKAEGEPLNDFKQEQNIRNGFEKNNLKVMNKMDAEKTKKGGTNCMLIAIVQSRRT